MVTEEKGGDIQVTEVSIALLSEHSKQAEYSPLMSKKKWAQFVAGVAEEGIKLPLVVTRGFQVIDGKHRLRAARELGIQNVRVIIDDIAEDEIPSFITETKLNRDDLKPGQKAAIVIRLHYEEERQKAKGRMSLGGKGGLKEGVENFPHVEVGAKSREILGKKAGVTGRYIGSLLAVYRNRPDLFERVFNGEITINRAYTTMKKDEAVENGTVDEEETVQREEITKRVKEVFEGTESIAEKHHDEEADEYSLEPSDIIRNRATRRMPQFAREFVHDFDVLQKADEDSVGLYVEQLRSIAEGSLLMLEMFEKDKKRRALFEMVTRMFLLSKDESKLDGFIEKMGGLLNE